MLHIVDTLWECYNDSKQRQKMYQDKNTYNYLNIHNDVSILSLPCKANAC